MAKNSSINNKQANKQKKNETNKKQNKPVIVIYFVLICLFTHEVLRRF